jgi:hypothetical protein
LGHKTIELRSMNPRSRRPLGHKTIGQTPSRITHHNLHRLQYALNTDP